MVDPKETKSTSREESQASCCDFSFENCEEIFKKMQDCCSGKEMPVDCCAMMRGMPGSASKEADKD